MHGSCPRAAAAREAGDGGDQLRDLGGGAAAPARCRHLRSGAGFGRRQGDARTAEDPGDGTRQREAGCSSSTRSRRRSTRRNTTRSGTASSSGDPRPRARERSGRAARSRRAPMPCANIRSLRCSPPRSIALVGASRRPNTPGHDMVRMLQRGGFRGTVHAINPNYDTIETYPCVPSLGDLPAPPDLAVLSVRNERLEETLAEAIAVGARAAVIFASGFLAGDRAPPLTTRLAAMARAAGDAHLRRQLHGLLQRSRRRLDLRFPEPARAATGRHRVHRPFGQRVRRARAQRSAAALRAHRLARPGAHDHGGRLHRLRARAPRGEGDRPVPRDRARPGGLSSGAGEGGGRAVFRSSC